MRYVALGIALFALGLLGFLVYVNYFSETRRGPDDVVLGLAYASTVAGIAVTALGLLRVGLRRNR